MTNHTTRQEEHDAHIAALRKAVAETRAICDTMDRSLNYVIKVSQLRVTKECEPRHRFWRGEGQTSCPACGESFT